MFTGIIEETGIVKEIVRRSRSIVLKVEAKSVLDDIRIGDSIAVNGVCLTAASFTNNSFTADVMPETMQRSNLGNMRAGSRVNLERALTLQSRLGGHIVSGHIDGMGSVLSRKRDDNALLFTIAASEGLLKYIIEKGSVAIDGISLTVVSSSNSSFVVSVIPHTQTETTLHLKEAGEKVNIETDIVGKYIERFIKKSAREDDVPRGLTIDFLTQNGF